MTKNSMIRTLVEALKDVEIYLSEAIDFIESESVWSINELGSAERLRDDLEILSSNSEKIISAATNLMD